ncbi:RIP metalloprotease RseP [Patescibacteria group bacterium]|nr:RIP metalloprotease RseP [Patescibacteria group bacterium]MBU1028610.1 RIP metalloprotease RseP [Patescibacteria group bacterium]
MIGTIITFIVVLSVIVFAHEFGHFFLARRAGVKVEEFGFGFPPRLWGVRRGDTIYSINAIPIGGFVRLKGEAGENEQDADSFSRQGATKRSLIIVAGVVMNLVLAWFLFSVGYTFGLPQIIDDEAALPGYARVVEEKLHIVDVLEGTPAAEADIQIGDVIIMADESAVTTIEAFAGLTGDGGDRPIGLKLDRDGEVLDKTLTPTMLEVTGKPGIGVSLMKTGVVSYPIYAAFLQGLWTTISFTGQIVVAFAVIIRDLVMGGGAPAEISGPVGIAVVTGEVARHGWRHLLQFTALLSINLGVINILPLPALDGGRLLFLIIERLRGRAINQRLEATIHNVGFALLLMLVLVVTYGDVVRFGDRILQAFYNVFTG